MTACTNCGKQLTSQDIFCPGCGTKVPQTEPEMPAAQPDDPAVALGEQGQLQKPPAIMKWILANKKACLIGAACVLAAIVLVIVIAAIAKGARKPSPAVLITAPAAATTWTEPDTTESPESINARAVELYKTAEAKLLEQDFMQAIRTFDEAIAVKPDVARPYVGKITAQELAGQHEAALETQAQAVAAVEAFPDIPLSGGETKEIFPAITCWYAVQPETQELAKELVAVYETLYSDETWVTVIAETINNYYISVDVDIHIDVPGGSTTELSGNDDSGSNGGLYFDIDSGQWVVPGWMVGKTESAATTASPYDSYLHSYAPATTRASGGAYTAAPATARTTTTTRTTQNTAPALRTITVPGYAAKSKSVGAARIDVKRGNITAEKQIDKYSFTPPIKGTYRFWITDMYAQKKVSIYVRDQGDSIVAWFGGTAGDSSVQNDGGITSSRLNAGQTYTIEVRYHNSGMTPYTLNIGYQKATVEATGYTAISDSTEFRDQSNYYNFTPPIGGTYRFWISDMYAQKKVSIYVRDQGDGIVAMFGGSFGDSSVSNDGGIATAKLNAGQTYKIEVRYHNSGITPYTLNIGYQKAATTASVNTMVKDSIQFKDQVSKYTFTAPSAKCRLTLGDMTADMRVSLYITDAGGGTVAYATGKSNNGYLFTEKLNPGQTYEIQVRQSSGMGGYSLAITDQ